MTEDISLEEALQGIVFDRVPRSIINTWSCCDSEIHAVQRVRTYVLIKAATKIMAREEDPRIRQRNEDAMRVCHATMAQLLDELDHIRDSMMEKMRCQNCEDFAVPTRERMDHPSFVRVSTSRTGNEITATIRISRR